MINNAGIVDSHYFTDAEYLEDSSWKKVLDIDLYSVIEGSQLALRFMTELKSKNGTESQESGLIINTASFGGFIPIKRFAIYCTAKFGVVGFTKAIGEKAFVDHGIRVVTLAPSLVKTPLVLNQMEKDAGLC